jgi:hypothetical protein
MWTTVTKGMRSHLQNARSIARRRDLLGYPAAAATGSPSSGVSHAPHINIAARFPIGVIAPDEPIGISVNVEFQPRHAFVASASTSILSLRVIVVRVPKSKPTGFLIGLKQAPGRIGR